MKYPISTHAQVSEILWASDFSQCWDQKAGTSRSHDVGRYELDLSGLIQINQTKTSRKPKKIDLTTSPEVRVVVETFFLGGGVD